MDAWAIGLLVIVVAALIVGFCNWLCGDEPYFDDEDDYEDY